MLKRLIGGVVAVATAIVLAPAGTAQAAEPPAPTPTQAPPSAGGATPTGDLVAGDRVGELVEGPQRTLVVAGGHIRIDNGFYYTIPVHYVKFDWTYTWKLKNAIANHSGTVGILCGYLPTKAGRDHLRCVVQHVLDRHQEHRQRGDRAPPVLQGADAGHLRGSQPGGLRLLLRDVLRRVVELLRSALREPRPHRRVLGGRRRPDARAGTDLGRARGHVRGPGR